MYHVIVLLISFSITRINNPVFLAFRCVQCSIGLADVNVKKYHRKMKKDIEQPGSDTWFFLYPKAIFFCVLKAVATSR